MKKPIISGLTVLSVILLVIFLSRFFLFSWQNFFRNNIVDPIPQSVSEFKYEKDNGVMHGAIIFQFKADKIDSDSIIEVKQLVHYASYQQIPEWIRNVLGDRFANVAWWPAQELTRMQIFGITWDDSEPHALFFFIGQHNKIYGVVL